MATKPEATKPSVLAAVLAGTSGALAGFASSFAIVMAGAVAVGATAGQAASGLLVVSLVQGLVAFAATGGKAASAPDKASGAARLAAMKAMLSGGKAGG